LKDPADTDTNVVKHRHPHLWFWCEFLKRRYTRKGGPEIRLLHTLVRPGSTAVDVGSSFGFFSAEMSRFALSVLAFEPNPSVAKFARLVAPANVEVIQAGLSNQSGKATLRVPVNARDRPTTELATLAPSNTLNSQPYFTRSIATKRLDDFAVSDCSLIKIDVEGFEEQAAGG
jgi:FkbM family methyltransferase